MPESYKEIKNRQMELMLEPARERLKKYTPEQLCEKAAIRFNESAQEFEVDSLGTTIHVSYPDFIIREDIEMWHHLTILQYMDTADGSPLSGEFIGLSQMPGGLSRGPGFDKDLKNMFANGFKNASAGDVAAAAEKLGGKPVDGKGDVTSVIYYAPKFPVHMSFWEADDEFAASGKFLVDKYAFHYLTIEAAGGVCATVVQELKKKL